MKPILLAATSACLMLAACNKSAEQRADEIGAKVDNVAEAAGAQIEAAADGAENRLDNAMDRMGAAITRTPTPQAFVDAAAKSDAFEIQAAQLAARNAGSAEVKAFAQDMIKAHTESTATIKKAAGKLVPNAALTGGQTEDLADLKKLTGAEFDYEYVDGQVDAHESALALMRSYAAGGTDADLKSAAAKIASVVENHLAMAREMHKKTDR